MKKTYVVTGCAGFIGSHMTERLLSEGHQVIGIDNFSSGNEENMKSFKDNKFFVFWEEDLKNLNPTHTPFKIGAKFFKDMEVDGVFHFAAKARIQPSIQDPMSTHKNNVDAIFYLLELMRASNIQNIVYSASSSTYGLKAKLPCTETQEPDCLNPYALTKYVGEQYCKTWGKTYGINNVCLKYFNVYGERSPLNHSTYAPVIGLFFRQGIQDNVLTVVGDGEQRRDFTYWKDVVEANYLAMQNASAHSGESFNVGCGKNYSINYVAQRVKNALGDRGVDVSIKHIQPRPAEARITLASFAKLDKAFGWHPTILLEDKIEELCEYYLKTIEPK